MPSVIVNISSIVAALVIQSLSTLELTVWRHFCSILKHQSSTALSEWGANVSRRFPDHAAREVGCAQKSARKTPPVRLFQRLIAWAQLMKCSSGSERSKAAARCDRLSVGQT